VDQAFVKQLEQELMEEGPEEEPQREARSRTLRGVLVLGIVIHQIPIMILLGIIRLTLQTTDLGNW